MTSFSQRRSRPSGSRRFLVLVVAPSIVVALSMVALYFVVLPAFPAVHQYYFPQSSATYAAHRVAILGHIGCGAVALVLGPINLWNVLRGRHRGLHRRIGATYAIAVAAAATFGAFMAFHAYGGTLPHGRLVITSGLFTLACVWLATLLAAVHAITVAGDVRRHAFWMIVNIGATYSAVFFRMANAVVTATGQFELLYPLLGWLGWLPSVAVAVVLARRHASRGRQRPVVDSRTMPKLGT
jgi:hypothetical protein